MATRPLALRIASLQYAFVGHINDIHIFLGQARPILQNAKAKYAESEHKKDRRYYVPAVGRTKFAKRKDHELKEIYDRFLERGLYESFIVSTVARFESFLADTLRLIILEYPHKLTIGVHGVPPCRQVSIDVLLNASEIGEALGRVIDHHIASVFYASPTEYFGYLGTLVGVDTNDPAFDEYSEIKATRDLLIHANGVVNRGYLSKVGRKARATLGTRILIDKKYFDDRLANLKRLSGIVKRDVGKAFPTKKTGS